MGLCDEGTASGEQAFYAECILCRMNYCLHDDESHASDVLFPHYSPLSYCKLILWKSLGTAATI